jgi:ribosome biogenesis GTPase
MNLKELGWMPFFEATFNEIKKPEYIPARVAQEHKELYLVFSETGALTAEISGRFRHEVQSRADFPSVGDWVAISARPDEGRATIHGLLPRRSSFSRKAVLAGGPKYRPGKTDEQVLAANIDHVFLVNGLDGDFNLRRIERYVAVAWDSGANPVIILNKTDLCEATEERVAEVEEVAIGVPIHTMSALGSGGSDFFREYLIPGKTAAFLGSSGVGKSTIINGLLGEQRLKTGAVSEFDDRGRHTTTYREMILLPEGGIVIDTPGMREIQMWDDDDALSRTFGDIEEIAAGCRFGDCKHGDEPGCAIRMALENGSLDPNRYQSYLKMQKELLHLARRKDVAAQRQQSRAWNRKIRQHFKQVEDLKRKGLM